jgi:hypothetical protein
MGKWRFLGDHPRKRLRYFTARQADFPARLTDGRALGRYAVGLILLTQFADYGLLRPSRWGAPLLGRRSVAALHLDESLLRQALRMVWVAA